MAVINARLDCIEDLLTARQAQPHRRSVLKLTLSLLAAPQMLQNTVQARHSQKLEIIVIVVRAAP